MIQKFTNLIKRLTKTTPLTWNEMDQNITDLSEAVIDQSIRNDCVFDKSITLKPDVTPVSTEGNLFNKIIVTLPLVDWETIQPTNWQVYGSAGLFTVEAFIKTGDVGNTQGNAFLPLYSNRIYFEGDYPGLSFIDSPMNTNANQLFKYDIETTNGQNTGMDKFVKLTFWTWGNILDFKIVVKSPDDDFINSIYNFNSATAEVSFENIPN